MSQATFNEQAADSATPGAGQWTLYTKSTGLHLIDDLGAVTGPLGTGGGTALPVDDATALVKGSGDPTKLVRIEADGLTTGTTREIAMADQNVDLTPNTGTFPAALHAARHTDGSDDIQNATAAQKGLATAAQITKLDGIETAATADQTDAEIKTAYENNADTNEFSDAEQTKLTGIATGAQPGDVEVLATQFNQVTTGTWNVPAGKLATNGDAIEFQGGGEGTGGTDIVLKFDGVILKTVANAGSKQAIFTVTILRTSATGGVFHLLVVDDSGTADAALFSIVPTWANSNDLTVEATGAIGGTLKFIPDA